MRMRSVWLVAVALCISFGLAAAEDPLIGTWNLNVSKSKYSPGPPPKSGTVKYQSTSQGIEMATDGVNAEGNRTVTHYTASYDGKDYPVTGSQNYDTISMKRINLNTTEVIRKKGDKIEATLRRVVSKDGKTLTMTTKGTNAKGQAISDVVVYEKQ
jgi:hypothetical protein